MLQLPSAFAAMAPYRQWILYQLVPDAARPGKTFKYPIAAETGARHDAHDASIWLDFETAAAWAAYRGQGYGVGFVFTENDPFFLLDIDDCLQPDGNWSPIALELCATFAGAAVEVSQSGRGLHIIGSGIPPADHRNKSPAGFDLYTQRRFVALTGTGAQGDAGYDCSPALAATVARYLQPVPGTGPAEWTDGPCAEWNGPADDAKLLDRMLRSNSASSAFGSKASAAELWDRDEVALTRCFPSDQGEGYDASRADMALAQHLAFWTGKDCERIKRLMLQSGLSRDKWERREAYLDDTICKAIGQQKDVYHEAKPVLPAVPSVAPAEAIETPRATVTEGATFLNADQQVELFAGCVYVTDRHAALVPGGQLLKPEQFRVRYGGYSFPMDNTNERCVRNAWEAFTESQCFKAPQADSTCFKPNLPAGCIIQEAGRTLVNTWWPVETARAQGDASPFLRHLAKLLPNHNDQVILLSYMAAIVQHKGVKFQWAPLIQGVEGNGKTLFSRCVAEAVGKRYTHWPKASKLTAQFNAWLVGRIFIAVEDIYVPDHKLDTIEELKPMITGGDGLEIEAKGVDQMSADICANFILNSNHKDALRKTRNDRRYCVLYCAQQSVADLARDGMGGSYMRDLYDWLKTGGYAIVTELLSTYPIDDRYNPATGCQRAPDSSSTGEAIAASLGKIEQEIMEAVEQGVPGFAGGWVSSIALNGLMEKIGSKVSLRKRGEMMRSLGYVHHPALPDGRVNNPVSPDGGKPRLYVHEDSPALLLTAPQDVADAYSRAQVM